VQRSFRRLSALWQWVKGQGFPSTGKGTQKANQ